VAEGFRADGGEYECDAGGVGDGVDEGYAAGEDDRVVEAEGEGGFSAAGVRLRRGAGGGGIRIKLRSTCACRGRSAIK
jgi:hypothetical protein